MWRNITKEEKYLFLKFYTSKFNFLRIITMLRKVFGWYVIFFIIMSFFDKNSLIEFGFLIKFFLIALVYYLLIHKNKIDEKYDKVKLSLNNIKNDKAQITEAVILDIYACYERHGKISNKIYEVFVDYEIAGQTYGDWFEVISSFQADNMKIGDTVLLFNPDISNPYNIQIFHKDLGRFLNKL